MNPKDERKLANALNKRDWPTAEKILRRKTAKGGSAADFYNLGAVLNEMGRWRFAITALKRARKMAPRDEGVLMQLGRAALAEQDLELAADAFGAALQVSPGNRMAKSNFGKLSLRLGDWKTAREVLKDFKEPEMRMLAYRAAAEMGDEAARAELDALLAEPRSRAAAVSAMAKTGRGRIPLNPPPAAD
ncbi:MAG: tetratricopeptide repeat protein [Pseudomonadota bacterium]